jgi:hypothetical protein
MSGTTVPGWFTANIDEAIDIMREIGIGRLSRYDGCRCSYVVISGVRIETECHKKDREVRLSLLIRGGSSMEDEEVYAAQNARLKELADLIVSQLREFVEYSRIRIVVNHREYRIDVKADEDE